MSVSRTAAVLPSSLARTGLLPSPALPPCSFSFFQLINTLSFFLLPLLSTLPIHDVYLTLFLLSSIFLIRPNFSHLDCGWPVDHWRDTWENPSSDPSPLISGLRSHPHSFSDKPITFGAFLRLSLSDDDGFTWLRNRFDPSFVIFFVAVVILLLLFFHLSLLSFRDLILQG